ncbi:hypothetical protein [Streptomyces sp. NPDC126499]|uniref:hypothetical protein n=1 Tax=Streptomyces sp. NPDC126499 TaxID=3155314 RepID=UPI0033189818
MSAVGGTHGKGRRPGVGGHVVYQGQTWQVAALQGRQVCLPQEGGTEMSLLLGRLFADPGVEVVGAQAPETVPQWGLFETVPLAAQQRALAWLPHIREVETGWLHPEGSRDGQTMRPEYAPERWTLAQREAAKAKELAALGFARVTRTTVQRKRHVYRKQGLWGLVDKRAVPARGRHPTGYADERVVAAVLEALRRQRGRSKGTVKGLQVFGGVDPGGHARARRGGDAVPVDVLSAGERAGRPGRSSGTPGAYRHRTRPRLAGAGGAAARGAGADRHHPPGHHAAWTSWPSWRMAAGAGRS